MITGEGFFSSFFFERQTVRHRNQLFNLGHLRTSFQAVGKKKTLCARPWLAAEITCGITEHNVTNGRCVFNGGAEAIFSRSDGLHSDILS